MGGPVVAIGLLWGCAMNGTTFDALEATETLERAGFDERQTGAVAGVVREAVDADRDKLATKADLDTGLAALETRLTVRLFGGLFAVASLNVAAMAALKLFA